MATNFDYRARLKEGDYLDVIDTQNEGRVAQVTRFTHSGMLHVHYDNWKNKYDEVRTTGFSPFYLTRKEYHIFGAKPEATPAKWDRPSEH